MEGKYCYSFDEEYYQGDYFDTPERAAAEALATSDERVFVGQVVEPPSPETYFDLDDFLEHVSCQDAYQIDAAEDWGSCSQKVQEQINATVQQTLRKCFEQHGLMPTFFLVEGSEAWELRDGRPVRSKSITTNC